MIPNATNGLTLFSGRELRPNGPSSLSTIGAFKVAAGTFTTSLGHTLTTEMGALKITNKLSTTQDKLINGEIKT